MFEKTKINEKEAEVGPFFLKKTVKMSIKKLSMARFEPAGLLSNRSQMCHKHEYL